MVLSIVEKSTIPVRKKSTIPVRKKSTIPVRFLLQNRITYGNIEQVIKVGPPDGI